MKSTYFFKKSLRFVLKVALVATLIFSSGSILAMDTESIRCYAAITGENRIAISLNIVSKAQDFDSKVVMKVFLETEDGDELVEGKVQELVPRNSPYAKESGLKMHSVFIQIYFAGDDVTDEELSVEAEPCPITVKFWLPSGTRLRKPGQYYVVFEWAKKDSEDASIAKYEFFVVDSSYLGTEPFLVIDS